MRGQLHHRACHRRVLQYGAGRGRGDGRRAGGRGLSPCAAAPGSWTFAVCIGAILVPGPELIHAPSFERSFQFLVCTPLLSLIWTSGILLLLLLLSFPSDGSIVLFGLHTSRSLESLSVHSPSLGQLGAVNPLGRLPSSPRDLCGVTHLGRIVRFCPEYLLSEHWERGKSPAGLRGWTLPPR